MDRGEVKYSLDCRCSTEHFRLDESVTTCSTGGQYVRSPRRYIYISVGRWILDTDVKPLKLSRNV